MADNRKPFMHLQIRLDPEFHNQLQRAARQDHRSMAQFVRIAVEDRIASLMPVQAVITAPKSK